MLERLQKIVAQAGVCSRRKAEELITAGRVAVDGQIITELGTKANPKQQRIMVDGRLLAAAEPPRYFLFYKPRGVVATLSDPQGRPALPDFVPHGRRGVRERVYPVGRLDYHSEGLILLTNDGALAYRVMHASSHLPKTYLAKVSGRPSEDQLNKLRQGVYLPEVLRPSPTGPSPRGTVPAVTRRARAVRTAPAQIRLLPARGSAADNPWLEVVLIEGRQNQIRRMFQSIGHPVEKLKRVRIGPLELGRLGPGQLRPLTPTELQGLRQQLRPERGAARPKSHPPTRIGRRA